MSIWCVSSYRMSFGCVSRRAVQPSNWKPTNGTRTSDIELRFPNSYVSTSDSVQFCGHALFPAASNLCSLPAHFRMRFASLYVGFKGGCACPWTRGLVMWTTIRFSFSIGSNCIRCVRILYRKRRLFLYSIRTCRFNSVACMAFATLVARVQLERLIWAEHA